MVLEYLREEDYKGHRSDGKSEKFKSEMIFKPMTIDLASQLEACRF